MGLKGTKHQRQKTRRDELVKTEEGNEREQTHVKLWKDPISPFKYWRRPLNIDPDE